MPCKYYDCGWCYCPEEDKTTSICGQCNDMESCPQAISWSGLISEPPKLLKFQDSGDDNEEHW